ncbi:MAG: hypothetical protein D6785_06765 [Planctomycetota bacterium]|nr:MAG: hypothetical protein D6785_06765 [Planctomycetota bacterium]
MWEEFLKKVESRIRANCYTIGITGLAYSGKTVFLTSLITQLKYQNPALFRYPREEEGEENQISHFEEIHEENTFPYKLYRDNLVNSNRWPSKTKDISRYRCRFRRPDWIRPVELDFFDFPGERIPDFLMGYFEDFESWSEAFLENLKLDKSQEMAKDYFLFLENALGNSKEWTGRQDGLEKKILEEYKKTLARLAIHYNPNISPSTFLIDSKGKQAQGSTVEEIIQGRFCGLEGYEFAPLSREFCQAFSRIGVKFQINYSKYRREVVLPLIQSFKDCHALVILVDIPTILASGAGSYNDNQRIFEGLFQALFQKRNNLFEQLFGPTRIRKIAILANKADLMHGSDRSKIQFLLKDMFHHIQKTVEGYSFYYGYVSPIKSTISQEDHFLKGFLVYNEKGDLKSPPKGYYEEYVKETSKQGEKMISLKEFLEKKMDCFSVSELPSKWPDYWSSGQYSFASVYPLIPARRDSPPEHLKMDELLRFLTG